MAHSSHQFWGYNLNAKNKKKIIILTFSCLIPKNIPRIKYRLWLAHYSQRYKDTQNPAMSQLCTCSCCAQSFKVSCSRNHYIPDVNFNNLNFLTNELRPQYMSEIEMIYFNKISQPFGKLFKHIMCWPQNVAYLIKIVLEEPELVELN